MASVVKAEVEEGVEKVDEVGKLAARAAKTTLWQTFDITFELFAGTLSFAFNLALRFEAFLVLFGIAECIIFLRYLIAHSAFLAELAALLLVGLVDTLSIAWDIFVVVVRIVTLGFKKLPYLKTYTVSELLGGNWHEELQLIPVTCTKFVEWQEVFGFFAGQLTRDNLCPFLRYIEPIPWLYRFMHGLLGWLSVDPTPDPGNNCADGVNEWLCAILGLGYLILQLVIPLLLALIALNSYGPLVKKLLRWTVDLLYFFIVRFLFKGILRAEYDFKRFGSHLKNDFTRFWMHRHAKRE